MKDMMMMMMMMMMTSTAPVNVNCSTNGTPGGLSVNCEF